MNRSPRLLACAAAGFLVIARAAAAQSGNSGILEGRIQVRAGAPIPLADIVATQTDGFTRRQAVSDSRGGFRLAFLPPGSYRLTVRRIGFRPVVVNDVLIRAGRAEAAMITLTTAVVTLDSLVVQAAAVHISTSDTEFGTRLTARDLALLPLPNEAKSLVAFTPGARPDQIWGAATAQANNYQLDGVAVNHPGIGGDFLQPSTSWIEEIQVRGLGAGAEYGNFQGGLVNIVTKSGSNRLQGAFRANGESYRLNSTNFQAADLGSEPRPTGASFTRTCSPRSTTGPRVGTSIPTRSAGNTAGLRSAIPGPRSPWASGTQTPPGRRFRPSASTRWAESRTSRSRTSSRESRDWRRPGAVTSRRKRSM